MQILFFKHYILVFNNAANIYFYSFSLDHLYFIISRCYILIFTKICQFDGLIYINQLLQNNKNKIMNEKKQYQANDDSLAIHN